MFKSTFHTHSRFDDGEEELESYIRAAITKGLNVFGFSAHAPVTFYSDWNMQEYDFDEYIETTKFLKEKYKDTLEIYIGLETDYYPDCVDWRNKKRIDYTIGGIHFFKDESTGRYFPFDASRHEFEVTLREYFDDDMDAFITAYYSQIREMLITMTPNIVAHLDIIKKSNEDNTFFDEDDEHYREEVLKTLEVISLTHTIVEVNTGGLARGYIKETYPSKWILENCLEMEIPIMINSDSHRPEDIDAYYYETVELLKSIGFSSQRVLYRDEWRDITL